MSGKKIPYKITSANGATIGDKFIPRGKKNKAVHTVVDIYTVINSKGLVIKYIVIAEHEFLGQKIESQWPATSVVMGRV